MQRADLAPPTGESGLWFEDDSVVLGTLYYYIVGTTLGTFERLAEQVSVFAYEAED